MSTIPKIFGRQGKISVEAATVRQNVIKAIKNNGGNIVSAMQNLPQSFKSVTGKSLAFSTVAVYFNEYKNLTTSEKTLFTSLSPADISRYVASGAISAAINNTIAVVHAWRRKPFTKNLNSGYVSAYDDEINQLKPGDFVDLIVIDRRDNSIYFQKRLSESYVRKNIVDYSKGQRSLKKLKY